jgi:hypothetical protein
MPTLIETNVGRVWAAKQTAKGTAATVASRSFKQVGGNTVVNVDTGSENYSDGTKYGAFSQWLNSVLGQGQPTLQTSVDDFAWWMWIFHGSETVTPSGTNAVQTVTTTGTPTGGTFTLTFEGRTTATIAYNASAAVVQAALEALPNIGTGNVLGGGGPLPTGVTLTFQNALAEASHRSAHGELRGPDGRHDADRRYRTDDAGCLGDAHVHAFHDVQRILVHVVADRWPRDAAAAEVQRLSRRRHPRGVEHGDEGAARNAEHVQPRPGRDLHDRPDGRADRPGPAVLDGGAGHVHARRERHRRRVAVPDGFDEALSPYFGDAATPMDLQRGNAGRRSRSRRPRTPTSWRGGTRSCTARLRRRRRRSRSCGSRRPGRTRSR